jgi:hypothetical protein
MPLILSPTQVGFNARGDGKFNKPFQEQVDFFKQKLNLPTERYDDILKAAHDRAFVVAGAAKADLLADLRNAVDNAIANGKSIQWFRKNFADIVRKNGWEGWTGSDTAAGRDWRARVIYQTNLSTSYAAGRWAQLNDPDLLKIMPFWKYVHNDTVRHPRELHLAWSGMVLRHDDPWWHTHFPPNGWGCRCRVTAVSVSEYKGEVGPTGDTYSYIDKDGIKRTIPSTKIYKDRYGNEHELPVGIDYGWDYAPGANKTTPLKDIIDQKLIRLPPAIGAEMWQALKPVLKEEQAKAVRDMVAVAAASMEPAGVGVVAHVISPTTVAALQPFDVDLQDAAVWLRDRELIHAVRDSKVDRGAALPLDVWLNLAEYLDRAKPYFDTVHRNVIYAFDLPDNAGKVAIELNRWEKVRDAGIRKKVLSNFIVTGGIVRPENLAESRYIALDESP